MEFNQKQLALIRLKTYEEAQENFWQFRQLITPDLQKGWFAKQISYELQAFYEDLKIGKRPKLIIQAPPQHGKTAAVTDFIAWCAGQNPDWKTIYTSFSDDLGITANLKLQRIYDSEIYHKIFPKTIINSRNSVTISGQALRNQTTLSYVGKKGYFMNTTVGGQITGKTLDIGIIDDPIKGRDAAGSPTIRNKSWEWLTNDFFTRFTKDAGMLSILTRWHVDDPIGRLIKARPDIKLLSYKAIATQDEEFRKEGEALFPGFKPLDFLLERKQVFSTAEFEALYQQNPIVEGGQIIKGEWFPRMKIPPKIIYRKIFGDTAQKVKEHNDYSVFECWGACEDGKIILLDMIRGKWEAPELKRQCVDFWNKHADIKGMGALRNMVIEDKSSGTGLIQDIKNDAHIPVQGIERVKDKLTRLMDVVSYIESKYICLLEDAPFVSDFVRECEEFTADDTHTHDDQIDPMIDAINDMCAQRNLSAFDIMMKR